MNSALRTAGLLAVCACLCYVLLSIPGMVEDFEIRVQHELIATRGALVVRMDTLNGQVARIAGAAEPLLNETAGIAADVRKVTSKVAGPKTTKEKILDALKLGAGIGARILF